MNYNRMDPEEREDERGVNVFTRAMRTRLSQKREQGRSGWHDPKQCTVEHLVQLLLKSVKEGRPVDIANFCMMVYMRNGEKVLREAMAKEFSEKLKVEEPV